MTGGTIQGCAASLNGGAVYVTGSGQFTMSGGAIIQNNEALQYGGGLFIDNGTCTINGATTKINSNESTSGGGIYINLSGTVTMNDGEIDGNTAINTGSADTYGGGVYARNIFTMNDGKITNNIAQANVDGRKGMGGGVAVFGTNAIFTMNDGEISGNTAKTIYNGALGGGVYYSNPSTYTPKFLFSGGKIKENKIEYANYGAGSGVFVDCDAFVMDNNARVILNSYGSITANGGVTTDNRNTICLSSSTGSTIVIGSSFVDSAPGMPEMIVDLASGWSSSAGILMRYTGSFPASTYSDGTAPINAFTLGVYYKTSSPYNNPISGSITINGFLVP
jgi:hypothetical protein